MSEYRISERRREIPKESLNTGRVVLGALIAATSAFPLFFVRFDEPSAAVILYKFLAKLGSFVGGMFLIWQFFLGFRGAVSRIFPDLSWVVDLHKNLGQYGTLIIPLHPIFIGIYYLEMYDTNIYALDLESGFSRSVLLGMILFGLVAFIVVSSAFFRQRMKYYTWFTMHLSSYLVPPLLFTHSFLLGPTIRGTPLQVFWWALTGLMAVLYAYRIFHKIGMFAKRYRVERTGEVAEKTTEIVLKPVDNGLKPAVGQFVYLRRAAVSDNAHPYTVSSYDEGSGLLGVTVKEEGAQTADLQRTAKGAELVLDGPFGVFTRVARANTLPMVMIAGGIGITPFRRMWRVLERDRDREAWLFYGNEFYRDIVYREELDALRHVRVVHVLNQEPDFPGEKGFITVDMLKRHISRDLAEFQFLLCGPPIMVIKLEKGLEQAGVPDDRVQHELFAT